MAIATYTDLQAAIADYLTRSDLTAQIPAYFITLAEATLNRVLRSTRMTADASLTLAPGARNVAVPADMLDPIYLQGAAISAPLIHVSMDKLMDLRRYRMRRPGAPIYYGVLARNIEVAPTSPAAITLDLTYYQAIPPLSANNTSNWLLAYAPDVYLYASLLHAAPLLKDADQQVIYGTMVAQVVTSCLAENKTATLSDDGAGAGLAFVPAGAAA